MNEAIFINYQKSKQLEKIKELQREILNAERTIEVEIGKVVVLDEGGKYKLSLEIDEDLLKTCCKTIADNSNKLEQAYRELKENFEGRKSNMDKTTLEIYQHYGLEQDKKDVESGKLTGVDFLVGREQDIAKLTRNMAGFGLEKSQRVTIEYDKGYGYFIVKRSQMEYGASKETYIIK